MKAPMINNGVSMRGVCRKMLTAAQLTIPACLTHCCCGMPAGEICIGSDGALLASGAIQ